VRTLIADAAYDAAWTRIRTSLSVQGLPIAPANPITAPSPLIQTGAVTSPSAGSSTQTAPILPRVTLTTPLALAAVTGASETPAISFVQSASANPLRKMLTIQNNSSATPADTAPTLWIAFGQAAVPGQCLGIAPGAGVSWEVNPPPDDIFVTWGAYSNSGSTTSIVGAIVQSIATAAPSSSPS